MFYTPASGADDLVRSWIEHPALRELVEADGGTWPDGNLTSVLDTLAEFSTIWDWRGGQSRLIFKDGHESRTDERARRTYAAAEDLGLLHSRPPTMTDPDYLLILGGLATGVEPRVRYSAQLLTDGTVTTECVAALSSFRPIYPKEQDAAGRYAPDAAFEIDLFTAILDDAFASDADWTIDQTGDPQTAPRGAEARRHRPGRPRLMSFASKSGEPEVRNANTGDTYLQFADDVHLDPETTILIVTSSIYRPFQHMDAVRVLGPLGATVETVGVPSHDGSISHPPSAYLQEVRSGIRSARALFASTNVDLH